MKTFPLGFSPQGKAAPLTEGHFYEGNASQTSSRLGLADHRMAFVLFGRRQTKATSS